MKTCALTVGTHHCLSRSGITRKAEACGTQKLCARLHGHTRKCACRPMRSAAVSDLPSGSQVTPNTELTCGQQPAKENE